MWKLVGRNRKVPFRPGGVNVGPVVEIEPEHQNPADETQEPDFVRIGLLFYGAMAIAAVLWRTGLYEEPILYLTKDTSISGVRLGWDTFLGLALGFIIVVLSNLMTQMTVWGENLARAMAEALGPISTPNAILLAFASGLAEEMFFRGAMQPRLGFVAASLLFGAVHFVPRREFLPWTGFALVVGFALGGVFVYTGNLIAPVIAHITVNAVNLPMLVSRYGDRPKGSLGA
jgi:membrane protease YdiL (CAAX protease family)